MTPEAKTRIEEHAAKYDQENPLRARAWRAVAVYLENLAVDPDWSEHTRRLEWVHAQPDVPEESLAVYASDQVYAWSVLVTVFDGETGDEHEVEAVTVNYHGKQQTLERPDLTDFDFADPDTLVIAQAGRVAYEVLLLDLGICVKLERRECREVLQAHYSREVRMPNWCNNALRVVGTANDLAAFEEAVTNPETGCRLDFNRLVPEPVVVTLADIPPATIRLLGAPRDTELRHYWRVGHWGAKWPADDVTVADGPDRESLVFSFSTAWSPAVALVRHASRRFPTLRFVLTFDEPGCGLRGTEAYLAGNRCHDDGTPLWQEYETS